MPWDHYNFIVSENKHIIIITAVWVSSRTLDCNGVFAIMANGAAVASVATHRQSIVGPT